MGFRKIAMLHTGCVTVAPLKKLVHELYPEAEIMNLVDDSLLNDTIAAKAMPVEVVERLAQYALIAQQAGAEVILNTCSSVGEAVDVIAPMLKVPYVKIDQPMAAEAVKHGPRIALIATVTSTVAPSKRLLERNAQDQGLTVTVTPYLVDGALKVLSETGDQKRHNQMVIDTVYKAAAENDVIVFAQGSMAVLEPECQNLGVPVFSSPKLGCEQLKKYL
ncbi:aspartate/glutamate racemase family protein [Dielma fastidiosa]|uniref:aspartate/glutamate racemase family protein n=1 Tax=Dielma fastidiosa TaxID=1034346 RepID=UPI003562121F